MMSLQSRVLQDRRTTRTIFLITLQHTEECLSLAFVHALAGRAGVNLAAQRTHDYGVDGTFRSVAIIGSRRIETGYAVDFQLKATTNWEYRDGGVVYDLEVKTYNDMVQRGAEAVPLILILLCLPPDDKHWIDCDETRLILQHSCYWTQVHGAPTTNTSKKRIFIPRANALTAEAIAIIMASEHKRRVGA